MYKIVFQIPFSQDNWDEEWAYKLRIETPGDPHGPHVTIYPDQKDHEPGKRCTFIRCKHVNIEVLIEFANRVLETLPEIIASQQNICYK